jgi:hypothetical protein
MTDTTHHTTGEGPAAADGPAQPDTAVPAGGQATVDAAGAINDRVRDALSELDRRMSGVVLPPEAAAEHDRTATAPR